MDFQKVIQVKSIKQVIDDKPTLYDCLSVSLTPARINQMYGIQGDFLYVLDAPSGMNASIRFNENDKDPIILKKGRRLQIPFYRFYLTNDALAGGVLSLVIGKDLAFDLSELGVIEVYQIQQPVKLVGANSWDVAGSPIAVDDTVGGTLVKAAQSMRQLIILYNEGDNPARIGKTGVTFTGGAAAAGGILLPPGGSITIHHTEAIRAICGAGLTTSISFEEEYAS